MKTVFTTMGIGGSPQGFATVKTEDELIGLIKSNKNTRWRVIGEGSNIIFDNKGFGGLIIKNEIKELKIVGRTVYAGAGNNLNGFIKKIINKGLSGMEKMSGIPGTVGGAIYGCAGAYGQEIRDCLSRVRVFDGRKIKWLTKKQCGFSYRDSIFKKKTGWTILGAEFKFQKSDSKKLTKISREIIKLRNQKYPPGLKCPGSFFKNIVLKNIKPAVRKRLLPKIDKDRIFGGKVPVGYLLDLVGAKGMKIGGIAVSEKHGNLIYNVNGGTFSDLQKLIKILKQKVYKKFGIKLEEEVQYLS
ncbi:MAG: UDP-N-acetylmuramate dehydrogenase [Parcubacteria group bacterium Licking1014_17]|nr:MAG: UDP-N-acetylmuramate dehydrogenase [Parcubacteria group bacterium Licking1014_17]